MLIGKLFVLFALFFVIVSCCVCVGAETFIRYRKILRQRLIHTAIR